MVKTRFFPRVSEVYDNPEMYDSPTCLIQTCLMRTEHETCCQLDLSDDAVLLLMKALGTSNNYFTNMLCYAFPSRHHVFK